VVLIVFRLLKSQYAQQLSARQLEDYARNQADSAERKMQLAQVALRLQQAQDGRSLAQAFLSECHRLFGVLQGVVYACDDDRLQLAGSFSDGAAPGSLALGEGLLGQCAVERVARVVDTTGKHSPWTISSGLGAARPAALFLAPVLLQNSLLGVVELALLRQPDPTQVEQFQAAVELLAFNMEIKHER
jgi:GAF domain-containing protein